MSIGRNLGSPLGGLGPTRSTRKASTGAFSGKIDPETLKALKGAMEAESPFAKAFEPYQQVAPNVTCSGCGEHAPRQLIAGQCQDCHAAQEAEERLEAAEAEAKEASPLYGDHDPEAGF